jgi:hypothetical protein
MIERLNRSDDRDTLLGVFPGESERLRTLWAFDSWLECPLDVATTFIRTDVPASYRQEFVHQYLTAVADTGLVPIVTWEPFGFPSTPSDAPVRSINDGSVDEQLYAWGASLRAWVLESPDRGLIFRPAHEMNGAWYPWSAGHGTTPSEYIRMWRTLSAVFDDVGLPTDRVDWMWCINATDATRTSPFDYFPGEEYVDWIGVDGYNFGDSQQWSSWQSPATVFKQALTTARNETRTPIAIPEIGCSSAYNGHHSPQRKSRWIRRALALFSRHGVDLLSWFNMSKETDWGVLEPVSSDASAHRERVVLNERRYNVYPQFRNARAQFR